MKVVIKGKVIKDSGTARKFKLPLTMNLKPNRAPRSLKHGVYSAAVRTRFGEYRGIMYYGPRLSGPVSLEVHCFNFKKNMYGKFITVFVGKKLRGAKKFADIKALKKQIKKDITEIDA